MQKFDFYTLLLYKCFISITDQAVRKFKVQKCRKYHTTTATTITSFDIPTATCFAIEKTRFFFNTSRGGLAL